MSFPFLLINVSSMNDKRFSFLMDVRVYFSDADGADDADFSFSFSYLRHPRHPRLHFDRERHKPLS